MKVPSGLVSFGLLLLLAFGTSSAAIPNTNSQAATRSPTPLTTNLLSSIQIERGFRVELAASEPLVSAPVAMTFDENGRLFVAEMRAQGEGGSQLPPLGRINLLEDTDGDGVFD